MLKSTSAPCPTPSTDPCPSDAPAAMDMSVITTRLGLSGSRPVIHKAGELCRLYDVNFDSSVLGIISGPDCPPSPEFPSVFRHADVPMTCVLLQGEVYKAIICLEIAASNSR